MTDKAIKEYLRGIASKGGKATGKVKRRGNSAYYKALSAKAARARKRKS
jgi:hypothetical protein